jgi:PAS domain S-box-containing protein
VRQQKKAMQKDRIHSPDKGQEGVPTEAIVAVKPEILDEIPSMRRRAEELLLKQPRAKDIIPSDDLQSVIQELRVHQIELEMQNEELRRTQHELETSREKYFDLYDLAPIGYITLDEKGIIMEANLTSAILLGEERSHLVRQPLIRFIYRDDQDIYYHCHKQLVKTNEKQACEMRMVRKDGILFWVQIDISTAHALDHTTVTKVGIVDIDVRKQSAADLDKSHEQLRRLAAHLQSVREDERTRNALEIHDELGQNLTALKMDLSQIASALSKAHGKEALAGRMNAAIDLVSSLIGTVKQICTNLRPTLLDHLGIEAAIEWQAEDFQKRSGLKCKVAVASNIRTIDIDIANALFRVFQEALTNVLKHAQATKVEASLKEEDGKIVLGIHDNGVGISEKQLSKRNSFGLLGMRERIYPFGGTISITGKEQIGTTLTVTIPVSGTRPEF